MSTFHIFGIQITLSFVVFALVARWYVIPRLDKLSLSDALVPLLLTHCLRHLGLIMIVPVVTDPNLPQWWTAQVAYGDIVAQALAFAAIFAIRSGAKIGIPLVWIFNVVGSLDLLNAYVRGAQIEAYKYNLDSAWYVPTFVVPLLLVSHFLIFRQLIRHSRSGGA